MPEIQDAGREAVVEVSREIRNLVGQIDQLRFERRLLIQEVLGKLRVSRRRSRANV